MTELESNEYTKDELEGFDGIIGLGLLEFYVGASSYVFQLYYQGLINTPQFTLSLGDSSYIKFGAEETHEDDTNITELTI